VFRPVAARRGRHRRDAEREAISGVIEAAANAGELELRYKFGRPAIDAGVRQHHLPTGTDGDDGVTAGLLGSLRRYADSSWNLMFEAGEKCGTIRRLFDDDALRAAASPERTRSLISSRSNSAMLAKMGNTRRPFGVLVSQPSRRLFARSVRQLVLALDEFRSLGIDFVNVSRRRLRQSASNLLSSGRLSFAPLHPVSAYSVIVQPRRQAYSRNSLSCGSHVCSLVLTRA
jgi:hypothetical protein